jgi:predicted MFS family arabinose efflux permease
VSRLVDVVAPPRLGGGFRWLLGSSWLSNLGDGMAVAAGPLLVASLTGDPVLVASAALLQWLPPLLLGLHAGALSDRLDRRLLVVCVDSVRAVIVLVLAVAVLTGHETVALVLVALFALGCTEVFADNTTSTLLPMLVERQDLTVGNARLMTGFVTVNQLVGPAVGAGLFAAAAWTPFASYAVLVGLAALLVSRISLPEHRPQERRSLRADIGEGLRWALHHAAVRTLVLTIFTFNITFGAAWSILVLYARHRLGLGPLGFGLITSVSACGGLAGTLGYGALTRRVSLGNLMRVGLVVETLTHLALALTTVAWVAMVVFFVFGAHAFVWGTTSVTVRQRAVPLDLQGRVGAVNSVGTYAGLVLGSVVGGLLARHWGVTAPFWFAFGGSAMFVVLIWRELRHVAAED